MELSQEEVDKICDAAEAESKAKDTMKGFAEPSGFKSKDYVLRAQRNYTKKNIAEKKHYCETCNKGFPNSTVLRIHLASSKHVEGRKSRDEKDKIYSCSICRFKTEYKNSIDYHLKSTKHIKMANIFAQIKEINESVFTGSLVSV